MIDHAYLRTQITEDHKRPKEVIVRNQNSKQRKFIKGTDAHFNKVPFSSVRLSQQNMSSEGMIASDRSNRLTSYQALQVSNDPFKLGPESASKLSSLQGRSFLDSAKTG